MRVTFTLDSDEDGEDVINATMRARELLGAMQSIQELIRGRLKHANPSKSEEQALRCILEEIPMWVD